MTYSSNVHDKAYSKTGFGLQASTTFNITKKLQAYGQFNYGKGIGSYLNDLSNLNVDLVPDPDNEGRCRFFQCWVGMQDCSTTLRRMYLSPERTVYPDFTLKTAILVQTPIRIAKGNIL